MRFNHQRIKSAQIKQKNDNEFVKKKLNELRLKSKLHHIVDYAEKIYTANQLRIIQNKYKEEELTCINDLIFTIILNNYDLEQAIKAKFILRDKYEKQQKEISEYCNDLKIKSLNNEKVIDSYKISINDIKLQTSNAQKEYDKIIENISKENMILDQKINERIELFNYQKQKIIETKAKIETLEKDLAQKNKLLENRRITHREKYNALNKEYEEMKKNYLELKLKYSKIKNPEIISKYLINENTIKNPNEIIEKKIFAKKVIKDTEQNNKNLLIKIDDLIKKYNHAMSISSVYSSRKDTLTSPSSKKHTYTKSFY